MKVRFLILLLAAMLLVCAAAYAADDAAKKPVPVTKVLFMVGGPFHDNAELYPIIEKKLEGTGEFKITRSKDLNEFKAENIKKYDMVMIYLTRETLTKEQEQGLVSFVENGKSLIGMHCVTDAFRDSNAYWKLVGGLFRTHGHETFQVNVTAKRNPIVQGMSSFSINDETYCDDFHPDSKCQVLMRRDKDSEPVTWVQYYGKGRVFITALGHGKEAWENPAWQELVLRGAEWATFRLNP